MEISTGRLTVYRSKVMGRPIAERIGSLITASISSTLTVCSDTLFNSHDNLMWQKPLLLYLF